MVEVQPVIPVAANQSPKQVKIPVTVEISDTPGTKKAKVVLQGLVACLDLPVELRPRRCGQGQTGSITRGYGARLVSVFVRVTPKVNTGLGRTRSRTLTVQLPLTKLGQRLFAKLGANPGGLPLRIDSTIGDRRGRKIKTAFPTALKRQP